MMRRNSAQSGYTLIELLITVAVFMTMSAVAFEALNTISTRRRQEEVKVDIAQETRDFMDQMARDLRNSGYPNLKMYSGCAGGAGPCVLGATPLNSPSVAAGLVAVSATDVLFEGDMNQDGIVDSVRYTLQAGPGGSCPCSIRRSQVNKNAAAPTAQPTNYSVEMDNVINSVGGGAAYPIAGNTPWGAANNVVYATYKIPPVFTFFDADNVQVAVPPDLNGANFAVGQTAVANVKAACPVTGGTCMSLEIVLNVLPQYPDYQTKLRAGASMRTTVKVNN
jgi:prepilin-type N-terminal cleavage/methylation domain-containing protein